jgi:hypothetical protein
VTGPASTGEVAVSEILFQSLKDYKMNEFAMETGFSSPGKSVVGEHAAIAKAGAWTKL